MSRDDVNVDLDEDECFFAQPPLTNVRFWLVVVFGTTVAVVSILENSLLFYIFTSRKHHRRSSNLFLLFLSFFDVLCSLAYILLMSVSALADHLISPRLLNLYHSYVTPVLTISQVALTAVTFLILAAAFERAAFNLPCVQKNRTWIAVVMILLALLIKGSMFLEYTISTNSECIGTMTETSIFPTYLSESAVYHIWRFWVRNVLTLFLPFFLLCCFLLAMLATRKRSRPVGVRLDGSLLTDNERTNNQTWATTNTVIWLTVCHLVTSFLNVFCTAWEIFDKESLYMDYSTLYSIIVDLISLMTVLACASRLPIYIACQPLIRKEVLGVISAICPCSCRPREQGRSSQDTQSPLGEAERVLLFHSTMAQRKDDSSK